MQTALSNLANRLVLSEVLRHLGPHTLRAHWIQGEFHHDLVVELDGQDGRYPGPFLDISTNCNGGVKEVLCLASMPDRYGLWRHRCPTNEEFYGPAPEVLAFARTIHWFDPCNLLGDDARSELRPEYRKRQKGGGWKKFDQPQKVSATLRSNRT